MIEHLRAAGASVMFTEVDEGAIHHFRDELGLEFVRAEEAYGTVFDVFAPCALGGILNANTIPQLKCRAVAGGANNQLADPRDAESLRARGVVYAPDFVINSGGALAILGLETHGWTRARAEREVVETVRRALGQIFEVVAAEGITTEAAASQIAGERLSGRGDR